MNDKQAIRELVESWVVWRDAGDWERFRTVWFDDGRMMATWFQERRRVHPRQPRGFRARRQDPALPRRLVDRRRRRTRDRADEDDDHAARAGAREVECDVVCTGRFYDFLERRDGRWGYVLRQPIYEQDRLSPVDPALRIELDRAALERFPVGYRHLAYLQEQQGFTVKRDMPGLIGPAVAGLYASGARWLEGEPLDR